MWSHRHRAPTLSGQRASGRELSPTRLPPLSWRKRLRAIRGVGVELRLALDQRVEVARPSAMCRDVLRDTHCYHTTANPTSTSPFFLHLEVRSTIAPILLPHPTPQDAQVADLQQVRPRWRRSRRRGVRARTATAAAGGRPSLASQRSVWPAEGHAVPLCWMSGWSLARTWGMDRKVTWGLV